MVNPLAVLKSTVRRNKEEAFDKAQKAAMEHLAALHYGYKPESVADALVKARTAYAEYQALNSMETEVDDCADNMRVFNESNKAKAKPPSTRAVPIAATMPQQYVQPEAEPAKASAPETEPVAEQTDGALFPRNEMETVSGEPVQ
jgi:hypothetical protein